MVQRWNPDVDLDELRRVAETADHQTYTELVAAVYGAYAKLKGKDRWGDKTPHYIRYMDELDRLFPTPSSCTSSATAVRWPLRWPRSGGGRSAVTGAFWWRRDVLRAGAARSLSSDRYIEVRLEDVIEDPERELRRLCEFLGEDYAAAMLEYPNRFDSEEVRIRSHPNLAKPPTADLRDWRAGLTRRQQRAIESVCARAGRARVPVGEAIARALLYAWCVRILDPPGGASAGPPKGPPPPGGWRRRLGESALVGRWATGSPRD